MGEPPSDESLVTAFTEMGQAEALNELLSRHVKDVWAFIYPMVLNEADADDLTQKVFIRATRGIASFRGHSQFSTWLYQIAVNAVRGFLRARKYTPEVRDVELIDRVDGRAFRPDQFAIANELDDEMTAAMHYLPTDLRSALVLTTLNGLDPREAADIEGCSTATIYWRVHKARKLLRKRLVKYLQ